MPTRGCAVETTREVGVEKQCLVWDHFRSDPRPRKDKGFALPKERNFRYEPNMYVRILAQRQKLPDCD